MNKSTFTQRLQASPVWTGDRWGHFTTTFEGLGRRLKMGPVLVRYEIRVGTTWKLQASSRYENLTPAPRGVFIKDFFIPIA